MANSPLTPTMVLREALRVLHQKCNFIGSITRSYDDSFAKEGAKIGSTLKIRMPNEYTVRSGRALDVQETAETSVDLTVATQKGVDIYFTSAELALSIDDFSKRIIQPAVKRLAANVESDAMSMYKQVYNVVHNVDSTITWKDVLKAHARLQENLSGTDLMVNINEADRVEIIDYLKGLFQDTKELSKQYKDGYMGRSGGFDWMSNTLWPAHTSGTALATAVYLTDIAAGEANGSAGLLHVDTGATTFTAGDIIFIEDVIACHPESKTSLNRQMPFVITSAHAGGEGDLAISPSIISSGAKQNVTAAAVDGKGITKVGGASAVYTNSLAYHEEAFAFATADLPMPRGVDMAARETVDGISMRLVRDYDINSDSFPCRLDILYGYKAVRPQLACRLNFN